MKQKTMTTSTPHPALATPRLISGADIAPAIAELNISHLARHKAFSLSGGERRRLEITRALVTNPSFILLDEPFSGIDPIVVSEAQEIIKELKEKGLGILLTDHNVRETLAICDLGYLLFDGKIVERGTPKIGRAHV